MRWGGRWKVGLDAKVVEEDWVEVAEYGRTAGYQVARALNMGAGLPEAGAGKRWEFGVEERDGKSVVWARKVAR